MSHPITSNMEFWLHRWSWAYFPTSSSTLVNNIAFGFRIIAIALYAPLVLLAFLDITAYVIARTLQAPKDRRRPTHVPVAMVSPSTPKVDNASSNEADPSLSYLDRPHHGEPAFFHFEEDHALSGAGIFSPPMTRAPSPSHDRDSAPPFTLLATPTKKIMARGRQGDQSPEVDFERVDAGYEADVSISSP